MQEKGRGYAYTFTVVATSYQCGTTMFSLDYCPLFTERL